VEGEVVEERLVDSVAVVVLEVLLELELREVKAFAMLSFWRFEEDT
jgi:hypothetical protein